MSEAVQTTDKAKPKGQPLKLEFEDNALVQELCGRHDDNLQQIEERLGVQIVPRGNQLAVFGHPEQVKTASVVLEDLYALLEDQLPVSAQQVDAALRVAGGLISSRARPVDLIGPEAMIETPLKKIAPRSVQQHVYVSALKHNTLAFGVGPAGTGKTYLAVAVAAALLAAKEIKKIILTRPVVEAGEKLGFLPGTLEEKTDPYLRPLFDALDEFFGAERAEKMRETGVVEIAPLAYMRGRTLKDSYMILDEAQNTTPTQMKMFLTRLGEGSRIAVTGDPTQIDLPRGHSSGLFDALNVLEGLKDIEVIRFSDADVVRHELVTRIVQAYGERDRQAQLKLDAKGEEV